MASLSFGIADWRTERLSDRLLRPCPRTLGLPTTPGEPDNGLTTPSWPSLNVGEAFGLRGVYRIQRDPPCVDIKKRELVCISLARHHVTVSFARPLLLLN